MFAYHRAVRFEDIDAAQIVFFPRYLVYCHEALEQLFAPLEGGYASLIMKRRIGLPAVHIDMEFKKPLRYGEEVTIQVDVTKIGNSSCGLRYTIVRVSDGQEMALVNHICVLSDLDELKSIPIPNDIRALLEQHLVVAPDRVAT